MEGVSRVGEVVVRRSCVEWEREGEEEGRGEDEEDEVEEFEEVEER